MEVHRGNIPLNGGRHQIGHRDARLTRRAEGNVAIDPLPLSEHDRAHLEQLGGVEWIIVTNSDHVRDTARLVDDFGARVAGPAAERESFPIPCDRWLSGGDELVAGLTTIERPTPKP